ncbi:hypothetical protein [Clostridium magnum]|uniref:Uncharacterized protein n=1 Tax=Clostridium magnum DSM 2767 TaxID=1121326 RepID=A0A161XBN9_9CLOT|nr:hypothetical protein [Clostridium magnum]KZL91706.1 hypothetical protein CLMAG_34650 [Clostridium magnum DSM 2767]SHJ39325.1 hypothetical protein SAMN02745944_05884 [Clostridium magnum DSM 2767]
MNILELEQIEQNLASGKITSDEAAKLIYTTNGQKPWMTKEWKNLRDKLIKDYCGQCGTTEGPFVLQHTWHPAEYQSHIDHYISVLLKKETENNPSINTVSQEELEQFIEKYGEPRASCPKCSSVNIKLKSSKDKSFTCNRCKNTFSNPATKLYVKGCRTDNDIKFRILIRKNKELRINIRKNNAEEIRKYAVLKGIEEHKRYMSCVDTVTFCKKCSYMWDKNKLRLCSMCGKRYHSFEYKCCINCRTENQK